MSRGSLINSQLTVGGQGVVHAQCNLLSWRGAKVRAVVAYGTTRRTECVFSHLWAKRC